MLNKAVIIGRITKNLELKHTQSGVAVTNFTEVVSLTRKGGRLPDGIS